jgi:hypothetical protein
MHFSWRLQFHLALLGTVAIAAGLVISGVKQFTGNQQKGAPAPILYFCAGDDNGGERVVAANGRRITGESNLVVATHGWYERSRWAEDLALAVKDRVASGQWACGWYDWRKQAKVLNPTDAAVYGRDTAGPLLGRKIVALSKDWRHIHLIGHSAGSWVISEAAKVIAKETHAQIHLTFLDAYVPPFWDEKKLGEAGRDPNIAFWADHYFTRDITAGATEIKLTRAHNVDLTYIEPGVSSHQFPRHWYHGTVVGRYVTDNRYDGKVLFNMFEGVGYGFERGLEAGEGNWQKSATLPRGNKPIALRPADSPGRP